MAEVEACEEVVVVPAIDHMELKVKSAEEFRARRVILARDLAHRRDAMANNSLHKTIMAEIGLSMADPRHPLNLDPGLKMNRDVYADMLEYSRERMPHLLDWIIGSLTDTSRAIQPEDIGRFGFLISQIIAGHIAGAGRPGRGAAAGEGRVPRGGRPDPAPWRACSMRWAGGPRRWSSARLPAGGLPQPTAQPGARHCGGGRQE